ncbi:hypothetical protein [Deinococcus budaensis]|uniref:Uncharacterized protein n=1 Tax=Deinococcus budaensis TaxID=1665626 RepID=A0A7W8GHY0_9DEIO|nr:hypothetical protein [Deinococcus budaensis]MBB5235974.1 hypothetical protein [Deinococcus budaensis]
MPKRSSETDQVGMKRGGGLSASLSQGSRSKAARLGGRTGTRTIAKANFISLRGADGKAFLSNRGRVVAAVQYQMMRPCEDGSGVRQGFDGQRLMNTTEVMRDLGPLVQEHKYAYRVVLSPDQNYGEAAARAWASAVLRECGHDCYLLFAHAGAKGHTPHPHVHAVVFTNAKLDVQDFRALRAKGDDIAWQARHELRLDHHMGPGDWAMRGRATVEDRLGVKKGVHSGGVETPEGGDRKRQQKETEHSRGLQMDH